MRSGRCAPRDLFKSDNRQQKQEAIMDHDQRYDATVLHNLDKLPAPAFTPEFAIGSVTGYAATDDGMTCCIRTLTPEGIELRLVLPTVLVEVMMGALRAVKTIAAGKTQIAEGETSVFTPAKYETITTDNYDGVLLAFDRGEQSEIVIALDPDAAFSLGQHLRKQVKAHNKLILPHKEIIA